MGFPCCDIASYVATVGHDVVLQLGRGDGDSALGTCTTKFCLNREFSIATHFDSATKGLCCDRDFSVAMDLSNRPKKKKKNKDPWDLGRHKK